MNVYSVQHSLNILFSTDLIFYLFFLNLYLNKKNANIYSQDESNKPCLKLLLTVGTV